MIRTFSRIAIFFLILLFSISGTVAQQKIKLGHIDFQELYLKMPGLDSVKQVFESYNKTIQEQYTAMQTELENKYMDYQANVASMSEIIKQTKEAEINDLKSRLDAFEAKATQDLQSKEAELTSPIIEKAREAVKAVATENGYTYIFNSTEGLLLFAEPSDNVMDLVKKKLNIKDEPKTPEK